MTAADTLGAAVRAAEDAHAQTVGTTEAKHAQAVDKAAAALAEALAAHDEAVAVADRDARRASEQADTARAAALAKAEQAFDDAMRAEHNAPDVRITDAHGTLWLMSGRQRLASATPVHAGHWRVNAGANVVMVGDRVQARARLWQSLALDEAA